jgi:hypothetical protein
MDDKLARLKEIGFTRIGQWKMVDSGMVCELQELANASNVLYAFAVDGQLAYVGKTVQSLRARLTGYRNPAATQSTNITNNKNIRECLKQGKQVEVYMLPDSGLLHYGGFHLNLAAGLEDGLIRDLDPLWNGGQKEGPNQSFQPTVETSRTNTADDFRAALFAMFSKAAEDHSNYLEVNAGQLHRRVGGYPGSDHRMPVCCEVMRAAMINGDIVMQQPPKGAGASLTVRYAIPRKPL